MDYIKDKLEEKDKIVVDPYQSLNDDITIKSKALENIISNQNAEENQIKDDYDSLGSRAGRFLGVLGAGLRGENASSVAQGYRDSLDKQLQTAQSRYKDQRDSAYNQYKDLLARREALEKDKYQKERDQVKDQQFKEQLDYTKDKDNRLYNLELQKLQDVKNAQALKDNQAVQDLNAQMQKEDSEFSNLEYLGRFGLDPQYFNSLKKSGGNTLNSEIYLFNAKVADSLGIKPENQDKWIKDNASLPKATDSYFEANKKMNKLLQQHAGYNRAYTRKAEEKKQNTISETQNIIDNAKAGTRIKFPSMPEVEFIIDGEKDLYEPKSGKMFKFENNEFIEIPTPSFR